jgi:hypothetical protein
MAKGKVTEIIAYVNGHPVYSGTKMGANVALQDAIRKCSAEGRAEPEIRVVERTVDYDVSPNSPDAVTETEITL